MPNVVAKASASVERIAPWLGRILTFAVWGLLAPFLFFTLYATAQLQLAAKQAVPGLGAVSNISIIDHLERLDLLDVRIAELSKLKDDLHRSYFRNDLRYTVVKHDLRTQISAIAADDPADLQLGDCAGRDQMIDCYDRTISSGYKRMVGMSPPDRSALETLLRPAHAAYLNFIELSSITQDEVRQIHELTAQISDLRAQRSQLVGDRKEVDALARTYSVIVDDMWWVQSFFVLPDGAIIGLFTGLMGAIGALVSSLFGRMKPASDPGSLAGESRTQSYFARPALGGLAGFIVYFAVSAGSGLLLQSGSKENGGALSPAALATLGLFAGLAAENALHWLAEKARGMFNT